MLCERAWCSGGAADCCTKGSDAPRSCLAEYKGLTSHCNPHMLEFCTRDRLFSNTRCIEWAKKNPAAADAHTGSVCNSPELSGLTTDGRVSAGCVGWCRARPGRCDATMPTHCAAGVGPECACINNTIRDTLPLYAPECYDRACKTGGYMTGGMRAVAAAGMCPNVMRCSAGVNIEPGALDNVLSNVTVDQSCLTGPDAAVVTTTLAANTADGPGGRRTTVTRQQAVTAGAGVPAAAAPATLPAPEAGTQGSVPMLVWIFILFVALAIAVGVYFMYAGKQPGAERAPDLEPASAADLEPTSAADLEPTSAADFNQDSKESAEVSL